mmetsp:Transcript_8921/g.36465  ORF Transcript_8921/g.36465 Transcript_8921/m.36465 type:complete len:167 (-) Transcript_8921:682-1182(-)
MRVTTGLIRIFATSTQSFCGGILFRNSLEGSGGKFPVFHLRQRRGRSSGHREENKEVLNRLVYRSKQRGLLELDILLGTWAERHLKSKSHGFLILFSAVLDEESPELFKWLTGQERPPPRVANNEAFELLHGHVTKLLLEKSSEASRACTGRSWLRGWDTWSQEPQ